MKPTLRKILAVLAIVAASAVSTPLRAQVVVIPGNLAEPQRGKFMCWAAASMTAIKIVGAFEGAVPTPAPPTQRLLGIYNVAHDEQEAFGPLFDISALTTSDINAPGPRQGILKSLRDRTCPANSAALGECDHTGRPILLDLRFETTTAGNPLGFCKLRALMKAKRPVVFQWGGLVAPVVAGRKKGPEGDHYMVVLGTRVSAGLPEVQVWDPWPQERAQVQKAHLQWIPYTEYRNPSVDHGVPGETHGVDYFQIRRHGRPITPLPASCNVNIPVIAPVVLLPQPIDEVRRAFLPANIRQTLRPDQLPALNPAQRFGYSFPIVALTSAQIVAAAVDLAEVRERVTSSVLIAVDDASGQTDAFFSVVYGQQGWQRGGYVSNGVAAQLAETRKSHFEHQSAQRPASIADYYMLSIPSRRTFFAGYQDPRSGETMLVPVADDPAIGAYAGKAQPARDLLLRIATDIEADWARQARKKPPSGMTSE